MEQEFARELRWNNLAAEYQTMLYRVAFANMHNRADAEDVVQEGLIGLLKAIRLYDGEYWYFSG